MIRTDSPFLKGRREILSYLRIKQWSTVKKYWVRDGLPIRVGPSGRVFALTNELLDWAKSFDESRTKGPKP